jgi:tetratricopeptide (TPR) repeat protein
VGARSSRPTSPERLLPLAALIAACGLGGCAAVPLESTAAPALTLVELLRADPVPGAAELAELPDAPVLELDADMRAFVAAHVNRGAGRELRVRQLLRAVIGEQRLGIRYDERTFTAGETFRARQANCLSFTNLFIVLGRAAGLEVSFQEVEVPPDWTRDGDMLVLNRHINALVKHPAAQDQVVDFNMADFRAAYDRRAVSDSRGLAHYYSNLAAERMQAGDTLGALARLRKAAAADAAFPALWVNLGTLYLRSGATAHAAAAWQHALALDPRETVAMSNLERLARERGDLVLAGRLQARIRQHRMANPYYRHHLAKLAYAAGDYRSAIGHLRYAVHRNEHEELFLALLGLSYLQQGRTRQAAQWLGRAADVAEDPAARDRYHGKLERLRRVGAG